MLHIDELRDLEKALGTESAGILARALERHDENLLKTLVTKTDLAENMAEIRTEMRVSFAELRAEFKTEIEKLRAEFKAEIEKLRAEFKTEIEKLRAELRTEFKAEIEKLRTEMASNKTDIVKWMVSGFLAQTALLLVLLKYLP